MLWPIFQGVLRHLLRAIPTIVGIILVCFFLMSLAPGDLVDVMAADGQISDPEVIERLRVLYGLDIPIFQQMLNYFRDVFTLNFGYSYLHSRPVLDLIVERLPATLLLMVVGLTAAVVLGVFVGAVSALRVNTAVDTLLSVLAVLFFAIPSFWFSLMLVVVFSVKLGWFPVAGFHSLNTADMTSFELLLDIARHLVLPALSLALFYAAIYARVMRASMLQVFNLDFVRTARAKGLAEGRIVWRHVVKNALLPVVTLVGVQFGTILSGAVVIESVFSWPGLGSLLLEAMGGRNFPVMMGILIFSSMLVIVVNILIDIAYRMLDPRIGAS
jgi:ABC-type dipeptide/oligopeptide/nickel transport systems, permease components